jgi:hypothetical protein
MKKNTLTLLSISVLSVFAHNLYALGFNRPEANRMDPTTGSLVREYVEGAAHEFHLDVNHSCEYRNYDMIKAKPMPTNAVLAILPSAPIEAFDVLSATNPDGTPVLKANGKAGLRVDTSMTVADVFWSNFTDQTDGVTKIIVPTGPLYNLRTATNLDFKIKSYWENIGTYGHHGRPQIDSVSAAYWYGGNLNEEQYGDLEFRANIAKLKGCVAKVTVVVPAIQICGKAYTSFSSHPQMYGTNDFAPSFVVVRNPLANPYPAECATDTSKQLKVTVHPKPSQMQKYFNLTRLPGNRTPYSFGH